MSILNAEKFPKSQIIANSANVDLSSAAKTLYDVLIIGGGVVGTGIARDASLRGMTVALFERNDLSCGTTSRSSRLIHGGLRYLDTYNFGLVIKDLREREKLLHIAPHLIRPLKFVVPNNDRSFYQRSRLRVGMILYDLFSSGKSLPSHKMLSREEVIKLEPNLKREGLQNAVLFYDCQASFVERLAIENAISAAEKGAKIFNHVKVASCERAEQGSDKIVTVEKESSGERFKFRARIIVNASGPWADNVMKIFQGENSTSTKKLRPTKGIHIAVPKINENAIILYAKRDARLFFVLPWLGYTLIGTTDTDYSGDPADPKVTSEDISYLLEESSAVVPDVTKNQILFAYAGIRPLVLSDHGLDETKVSRDYKIVDEAAGDVTGLISVLGVKITSYRIASKETMDLISRKLGRMTQCVTDKESLPGGRGIDTLDEFKKTSSQELQKYGLDEKQVSHLLEIYGSRASELILLMESDMDYSKRICPNTPDIVAQIVLAVNQEFAQSVSDFLLRRAPIAFTQCHGLDCAEKVAAVMGKLLAWDGQKIHAEIQEYKEALTAQIQVMHPPKI